MKIDLRKFLLKFWKILMAGMDDFLSKPVDPRLLKQLLSFYLK
jgi:CheY-like chemotaxis protein